MQPYPNDQPSLFPPSSQSSQQLSSDQPSQHPPSQQPSSHQLLHHQASPQQLSSRQHPFPQQSPPHQPSLQQPSSHHPSRQPPSQQSSSHHIDSDFVLPDLPPVPSSTLPLSRQRTASSQPSSFAVPDLPRPRQPAAGPSRKGKEKAEANPPAKRGRPTPHWQHDVGSDEKTTAEDVLLEWMCSEEYSSEWNGGKGARRSDVVLRLEGRMRDAGIETERSLRSYTEKVSNPVLVGSEPVLLTKGDRVRREKVQECSGVEGSHGSGDRGERRDGPWQSWGRDGGG